MFHYSDSPPPLHHSPATSDKSRFPSRDSTPATPGACDPSTATTSATATATATATAPGRKERERHLPWFKRPLDIGKTTTRLCLDTTLLRPDFDDDTFPLFGDSPPPDDGMARATPIDIATRHASTSPRGQQLSTLTSALRQIGGNEAGLQVPAPGDGVMGRHESSREALSRVDNGARPISVKGKTDERGRRESLAQSMAPSMGAGVSWGGMSVGSWLRDDIMMSGTSPFAFHQSPSYHSSSYLPKLEANFMRDFACCGLTLPSLHDLLQHYEEAHAQKGSEIAQPGAGRQPPLPDSRAAIATNTAASIQHQTQQQHQHQHQHQQQVQRQHTLPPSGQAQSTPQFAPLPQPPLNYGGQLAGQPSQPMPAFASNLPPIADMDTVEDMEMDDVGLVDETTPPSNLYTQSQSPPPQYAATTQPLMPQLNTGMMQGHQAYRNSTPTTPIAPGRGGAFQHNMNVSSVNTPTLMTNPMQQQFQDLHSQYRSTPESSAPGTPQEVEETVVAGMDHGNLPSNLFLGHQNIMGGYGMPNDMIDLCIDEPAKRLFVPGNEFETPNRQYPHIRLGSGQYGPNSEVAIRIREQQMLAGLPDTTTGMLPHEEPKPFRCPVIGCEKAYKNQNGLKYHKSHGHNNQQLQDNADGTFSIVNPETSTPYPGTQGMEKEKPYKCDVCLKRYKNLNGLKYHKMHSPPCNPELQATAARNAAMMAAHPGHANASHLGAGLPGGPRHGGSGML